MKQVAIILLRIYRYGVSPMLPPSCRYTPTCSAYALEAIETHGAARGIILALKRVSRCHPFTSGGDDPLPPRAEMARWFRR
jgi:uncharacterized protein